MKLYLKQLRMNSAVAAAMINHIHLKEATFVALDAGLDADSVLAMISSQDRVTGIEVKALLTGKP